MQNSLRYYPNTGVLRSAQPLTVIRTNSAPSIGPLLGGMLASRLGWQWIFWFLSIVSGLCCVSIMLALPETSRHIVGNGSVQAQGLYKLPFPRMMTIRHSTAPIRSEERQRRHLPNPVQAFDLLRRKDTAINVFTIGVLYMTYSCIQASLSSLFVDMYRLSELQAGLIYLPFGVGCLVAAYGCGGSLLPSFSIMVA